ncbi:MAG: glycosyltransferase family 39 protein, partial [Anaerolineae bacterium]
MTKSSLRKVKLLALFAIIVLAAFFRLYRIDTVPPGDRYDPAYYGVDALRILEGERPIFLPTNFGREALFSYVVALVVALLGITPYSMYVASAIVGILTVPAVYLVVEELLAEEEGALHRYGGLLAALAVAISYWHLNWSRFGVRAILLPLFVALTIYFFWRALRISSAYLFLCAGFFLGLGMYTNQAARALPLLIVLGFIYIMVWRRCCGRRDLLHLALLVLAALVVFAPLGYYFLTHPGSFTQRIGQTSVLDPSQSLTSNLQALGEGLQDTLWAFSFYGDEEPTTNLPGRPMLNGFLSLLLLVGVLVSLLRIQRPVYLFVLTWLAVMSAPAVLSQYGPIAKRAIGTLPVFIVLIVIGALAPWDTLRRWVLRRRLRWGRVLATFVLVVIIAGFLYGTVLTYYDYFVVWAGDPDLFTHFEVGPTAIGQYVGTLPLEERVYISPIPPDHPSIVYNSHMRPGVKGYDGRVCVVVPAQPEQSITYVIVSDQDPNSLELLGSYFPGAEIVAEGPLHYQQPYFLALRIPQSSRALIAPTHPLEVNWANKIRLLGYDLDADVHRPGDTVLL